MVFWNALDESLKAALHPCKTTSYTVSYGPLQGPGGVGINLRYQISNPPFDRQSMVFWNALDESLAAAFQAYRSGLYWLRYGRVKRQTPSGGPYQGAPRDHRRAV